MKFRLRSTTGTMAIRNLGYLNGHTTPNNGRTITPSDSEQVIDLGIGYPIPDHENRILLRVDFDQFDGTQVIYDVNVEYHFAPPNLEVFSQPERIYDSREAEEGKFRANEIRLVYMQEDPRSVKAMVVNLTITESEGEGGFCALWPPVVDWPGTSSINWWGPGQNVANMVTTNIGPLTGGRNPFAYVQCLVAVNPAHVVIDAIGKFIYGYNE